MGSYGSGTVRVTTTAVLLLLLSPISLIAQNKDDCEQPKHGECFSFHGRYRVSMGDLNITLWPRGTHRLLRVMDFTDEALAEIRKANHNDPDNYDVYGDFTVCPLEKERKGWMREVCLKDAKNLKAVKGR